MTITRLGWGEGTPVVEVGNGPRGELKLLFRCLIDGMTSGITTTR